jgi:hypothetical protein
MIISPAIMVPLRRTLFLNGSSHMTSSTSSVPQESNTINIFASTSVTILELEGNGSLQYLRIYGYQTYSTGILSLTIDGITETTTNIGYSNTSYTYYVHDNFNLDNSIGSPAIYFNNALKLEFENTHVSATTRLDYTYLLNP